MVVNGAGAAALACLDLAVSLGLSKENVIVCDRAGVIYAGREEGMDPYKARYAVKTGARTLAEALVGADIFLGLSMGGVVSRAMVATMAERPLIMAMANPEPEIRPEEVRAVKPDAIIATGRSDYPNQVNNVLCFPFLFRGALDGGALGVFLSGAGSTILALTQGNEITVAREMEDAANKVRLQGVVKVTQPSLQGAHMTDKEPEAFE